MITLRAMVASDEPALVSLWLAAWREAMPAIDFEARRDWLSARLAELREGGASVIVVCEEEPLGFVTIDPHGVVDQLAVAPAHQHRGLGRALLDAALARHPYGLCLTVNTGNERAVRFYQAYGFAASGERVNSLSGLPVLEMVFRPRTA